MKAIGIIGTGIMGGGHARYLTNSVGGARVAAVFDPDGARAKAVARGVDADVAADPLAMIGDPEIDAVIIASPDATHPELALACLDAGTPALVEKPLATNPLDAKRVVDAAGDSGLLSLGFMRRFDPQHVALRDAAESGAIGTPRLFRSIHRNPVPPPDPSTRLVVTGSAIHDIDAARWLMGEFESVTAVGQTLGGADGVDDLVLIQGHHEGGGLSLIEVYVSAGYGYEVIAEVVGSTGVTTTLGREPAVTRVAGRRTSLYPQIWLDRFEDAYVAELVAWLRSLDGEPFPGATALDGYRNQLVAETVLAALESGMPTPVMD